MHVILQYHVGYKIQRLTSSHLNARNSGRQWQEETTSKLQRNARKIKVLSGMQFILGNRVNEEIRAISSSQNALVYQSKISLNGFEWDKHLMIFSTSAPVLLR